jgi:hypothetical protein
MKRYLFNRLVLATSAVALASTAAAPAHADDTITHDGRTYYAGEAVTLHDDGNVGTDAFVAAITAASTRSKNTCKPTNVTVTVGDPTAVPYTTIVQPGDGYYRWAAPGTVSIEGCDGYVVLANTQLSDQALDGVSAPTQGPVASARAVSRKDAYGRVHGDATAHGGQEVYYPVLGAGTLHQLVVRVWGGYAQSDTSTPVAVPAMCRTWTYHALPTGPAKIGSTPQAAC